MCVCAHVRENAWILSHYIHIYIIIVITTDLSSDYIRKWSLALRDMMSLVKGMLQDKSPAVPKVVNKGQVEKSKFYVHYSKC